MRGTSNKNILDNFCMSFVKIVEKYTNYIVVLGFVAISSGRTRATEDIDMIIKRINYSNFNELHKELINNNFVCVQSDDSNEIYSYLKDNLSVRYTWKDNPLPEMELKFVKDVLDEYQIKTRVKLELTGLDIWFSSIEMNIAFKEELLKSEKDLKDSEHLRNIYDVDEEEVIKCKKLIKRYR